MKVRSIACLMLLAVMTALAVSCGDVKGEFGFRKFGDDTYHRIDGTPEFASDEEVAWVFKLDKQYGERDIGIVCQRKELVWVEVMSRAQHITETDRAVYGDIKDFEPGQYRLVLTLVKKDNRIIDSKNFIIYEREDEADL